MWKVCVSCLPPLLSPPHLRYLFTLDLPEYWENKPADQTLEVLMSDLDPAIMDQFYMKDGVSASDVTRVSGRLPACLPAGVGLLGPSSVM